MGSNALSFYDSSDMKRHGFGDLSADVVALTEVIRAERINDDAFVVEVGCGTGRLADVHPGWFGVDLGHPTLVRCVPGRSAQGDATNLPIADSSANLVLSVEALEHVPNPAVALGEIARILAPGGVAYLRPAWYCSQWPMDPLMSSSWAALNWRGRARKALGHVRYSRIARAPGVLMRKLVIRRSWDSSMPSSLRWTKLNPDYSAYHTPDADAVASLEPDQVVRWFATRGFEVIVPESRVALLRMTRGPVIVRRPGGGVSTTARLACPLCRAPLTKGPELASCSGGHRFPVEQDVPRLVRDYLVTQA